MRVMLVGNPNCGKTTLFNALTGENQRVGNWPGVTVEKKVGHFVVLDETVELIDLPGVYSLTVFSSESNSLDEKITVDAVVHHEVDLIINVVDACQLERHLYLTSQLLELGKPLILALNMTDIANQRGIVLDVKALSHQLGCSVVPIQAHRDVGVSELKRALLDNRAHAAVPLLLALPQNMQDRLSATEQQWILQGTYSPKDAFYWANRLLEGDVLSMQQSNITEALPHESDILMADARYQAVHQIVLSVQKKRSDASEHVTAKIDKIVLHRIWAFPIFFCIMYLMFFFAINLGGALQDFFDISSNAVFVQGSAFVLQSLNAPKWVIALIANGVGKGINTTLTFIPVIASMFFFLALLETSGYMARAAFVVDKAMRMLGLPGKSFVPMIVGFGCNVPAIMAARTLDSERDRILTVLMSPFMSCSARLAIYAIFVATFFPVGGHNVVFSLYVIGILMAVFTGLLLRKTVFHGTASPLLLELPAYHAPSFRRLISETFRRLRYFITRAGRLIIPVCVILGGLNALTLNGFSDDSILAVFGQWITPIFSPMGLQQDNWPATVGLLTGMLAKEVVVGTLHTLYSQIGYLGESVAVGFDFWGLISTAFLSIFHNLAHLLQILLHPVSTVVADNVLPSAVSDIMLQRFDGQVGAYAYLLFVLLYIPCISTMAVIRQEAGRRFMWFSIGWSLVLAYSTSVVFYQLATISEHPLQTCCWVFTLALVLLLTVSMIRKILGQSQESYVITTS